MNGKLTPIRPLTWNKVLTVWGQSEEHREKWIAHYTARGFDSWRAWRTDSVAPLHPEDLTWQLFEISDPASVVPQFFGGPFRAWIRDVYGGREDITFAEIAQDPEIVVKEKRSGILDNFPESTLLLGLKTTRGIIVIDGMHRATAIAIAASKRLILKTEVQIALAEFQEPLPLLGQADSPT